MESRESSFKQGLVLHFRGYTISPRSGTIDEGGVIIITDHPLCRYRKRESRKRESRESSFKQGLVLRFRGYTISPRRLEEMASERAQMCELRKNIHGLTQALNIVIHAEGRIGAEDLYGNFQRMNSSEFNRTPDLDEAENWVKAMEQILRACNVRTRRQSFWQHSNWWEVPSRHLPNMDIEWDEFLELFNTKYFFGRIREKKEKEFTDLNQ
ncbi:hypothetical protein Taro_022464 [Colocasia esculenta]|uniref:Uncharacterized protein n=1 Tax=Colocasia esculenta TaxID=4460 RepID=A0A843V3V4_COLES|nr:hypothetical protein [Colocasia esculenta]